MYNDANLGSNADIASSIQNLLVLLTRTLRGESGIMKDTILLVVGFALSIVGAVLGALIQRLLDRRSEGMPLNNLLNFWPRRFGLCISSPRRDA